MNVRFVRHAAKPCKDAARIAAVNFCRAHGGKRQPDGGGVKTIFALLLPLIVLQTVSAAPLRVQATPILLDPAAPQRTRFGALTFLSGFRLRATDKRFGGLSGLTVKPDGSMLFTVSDRGHAISARLLHDRQGRLIGLRDWAIEALQTPQGKAVDAGLRDAEAIEQDAEGAFLVAFEGLHRIWRYPSLTARPQRIVTPPDLQQAPLNGGAEAMTMLPDGRLLVLTERYKNPDGTLRGWLIKGERYVTLSYVVSNGFRPTDLAVLRQDVVVLERHYLSFLGASVRLQRVSGDRLQAGSRLQGQELLHLQSPLNIDNFEGLAVWDSEPFGVLIYLISDDNFSPLQQTLLLQFRLDAASPSPVQHRAPSSSLPQRGS